MFFPGGDIGRLAVSGTVNDLAMMGATEVLGAHLRGDHRGRVQPRAIWSAFSDRSAAPAPKPARAIVTGDTKVMGKGEIDGIVINTTGIASDRSRRPRLRRCAPAIG